MPAIGKDLSKIRSHLGLSIQDIQHHTKIPVSTLKSIENGSIFNHPEENQTYIRSFVRSYGRALKIDDDIMIKALDQNETGNYNHLLLQEFPELNPERTEQKESREHETHEPYSEQHPDYEHQEETDTHDQDEQLIEEKEESEESSPRQEEKPVPPNKPTPKEQKEPIKNDTEPSVKSVDWANVGRKFSEEKKHTPVWIVGLIIILIIAAVVGYFLYDNGLFDWSDLTPQDQQEVTTDDQTAQSNVSLDLEDSLSETATGSQEIPPLAEDPPVELDEVLELTVYAAYDGLGPVRVWSDIKPRMDPYWLEQGTAMQFEFQDSIRVRGAYSDLLLFKDGNLIENAAQQFLQQEENYLQLTRDFFLTDEKWATAVDYELPEGVPPPDSLITRPTF